MARQAGSQRTGRVPAQESKRHVKIDFTQKRYLIDKFWHFHLLNEKIVLRICPLKTGKGDRIKYIQNKIESAALPGSDVAGSKEEEEEDAARRTSIESLPSTDGNIKFACVYNDTVHGNR